MTEKELDELSMDAVRAHLSVLPPGLMRCVWTYGKMSTMPEYTVQALASIHGIAEAVRTFGFELQSQLIMRFMLKCAEVADNFDKTQEN